MTLTRAGKASVLDFLDADTSEPQWRDQVLHEVAWLLGRANQQRKGVAVQATIQIGRPL